MKSTNQKNSRREKWHSFAFDPVIVLPGSRIDVLLNIIGAHEQGFFFNVLRGKEMEEFK